MGLYYSTDMVLRWYKADDSQLKQDRGRTQYTAISNDALVDLREHGITEDNVRQWLEENHVPPDGYTSPYDGTISDDALAEMTKSTADARAVTRAYSLLGDEGNDEQEKLYPLVLSNAIPALHEFRKLFVATVYKGNIIKNLIMDCQSYTKYRPNETTGGIFVSWRRKEELPTGA